MPNFEVAAVFSDHMVLQREKRISVFGRGTDGEIVTVTLKKGGEAGEKKEEQGFCPSIVSVHTLVEQERWVVELPPMEAGTGFEMRIGCGGEEKQFLDIAIGEVWLAGGQSNMEYELQAAVGGKEILNSGGNPMVRYYNTPRISCFDQEFNQSERASHWMIFDPESAARWSAVAYFFAVRLAEELAIPIGIIGCNWGGTSASAWMSREALMEDRDLASYVEEYEAGIAGKSIEEQIQEYDDFTVYQDAWQKRVDICYADNPGISWNEVLDRCGECRWPGPLNIKNPFRPSGLYECMLKRIQPYTLRGFLYYQGESDDHKPRMYYKLLSRLIRQWREDWEDLTLPFLFVQLPMHRYEADPDWKNWCLIREAQMQVYQTIRNTGIAVALDCGEFNEIHPKDKKPVGERLALSALYHVYQLAEEKKSFGPMYAGYEIREQGILLYFHHTGSGFIRRGDIKGFEIAGRDKRFVPAEAVLEEKRIFVSSPEIPEPVYVRYCWTNYGEVTIFGKSGIPLAPFRTSGKDEPEM